MSLFNFSQISEAEILSFFAVLVRYGVLFAVLPMFGDRMVPGPVKVLLALSVTLALFPALVTTGQVRPGEAIVWSATTGGVLTTVGLEALFGLALGFTAKLAFDTINFGANLVGNFMGFAAASMYDPHQESQTQVVAQVQMAIAMLVFLALDGHHLMLRASLDSYRIVGMGQAGFGAMFSQTWLDLTSQVIRFGVQIAAPISVCLFGVNLVFGVMAKSMPQMNVLVLSFAVTSLVGLLVLLISVPQFTTLTATIFEKMGDSMQMMMAAMAGGK